MARVTVEDCLEQVPNRFALVLLHPQCSAVDEGSQPLLTTSVTKSLSWPYVKPQTKRFISTDPVTKYRISLSQPQANLKSFI